MTDSILYTHRHAPTVPALRREGDYLVAPIISAREMVMNGIYYPAAELAASAADWDGVLTPLGHPTDELGRFISANAAPGDCPGTIRASEWRDGALRHEVWLNTTQAPAELLARLEAGQMIEVSTGLYADIEPAAGEFNGQPYSGIARNIRPDHIAILLHERGACSRDDGCGFPRVNKKQEVTMPDKPPAPVRVHMELTLDETLGQVYEMWREKFGYEGQLRDIYADRLIVRNEGRLMQYGYAVDADGRVTFGEPVEVEYTPMTGGEPPMMSNAHGNWLSALKKYLFNTITEEAQMDRDKLIQSLLANERNALSQETLTALGDDELAAYAEQLKPPCAQANAAQPPAVSREQFDELLAEVRGLRGQIQANTDREKSGLIGQILAHSDIFTQAELSDKPLAEVQKLHRLTVPADYSGRGEPVTNAGEWVDYEAPVIQEVN